MAATFETPHRRVGAAAGALQLVPQAPSTLRPHPAPRLRVVDGGRSEALRRRRAVYRRRRLGAAVLLVLAGWLLVQAVHVVTEVFAPPPPAAETVGGDTPGATSAAPAADVTYVVRGGDSLWSIARRVAPDRDPREIVDELSRRVGGAALQPGQRIDVHDLVG